MEHLGWIGFAFVAIGGVLTGLHQLLEDRNQEAIQADLKNQIIGGDGYAILELVPSPYGVRSADARVRNRGKYLLYDITVEIESVTFPDYGFDSAPVPHVPEHLKFTGERKHEVGTIIPERDRKIENTLTFSGNEIRANISVGFYARNGFWRQHLGIYWPKDGEIEAAWIIRDEYPRSAGQAKCARTKGFPLRESDGKLDWKFGFGQHPEYNYKHFPEQCEVIERPSR